MDNKFGLTAKPKDGIWIDLATAGITEDSEATTIEIYLSVRI